MQLKNLVVDTKSAWVDFPGMKGFSVEIANLSRPAIQALRKKCLVTKFDRKTRVPIETLDEEKYVSEFTRATVKNWKGLKISFLEELILTDTDKEDPDSEIPYSQENAEVLVSGSPVFDDWLSEAVFDLENFRSRAERAPVDVSNKVAE